MIAKQGIWYDLAGGTALALYLWHRESIDLDFVVYDILWSQDTKIMKSFSSNYQIIYESDEQIDLFVDNVKLTLFSYRWKPLFPTLSYQWISLWDMRDIAISKASTIWRRSEIKDYIDLYVILSEDHLSIHELIQLSEQKLWWDFSSKLFLKQLLLVESCEEYHIPLLWDRIITKDIMQTYFAQLVQQYITQ
jgi:hypothetical protein